MSFVGSYTHSLDPKKRVFIPAKYREELGNEFYITRKSEPYLSVYKAEDWEKFVNVLCSLPETESEDLIDYLLGAAQKCVPDSSGRIILDDALMEHAKIEKNVVFMGAGTKIKIWAEEVWKEREAKHDKLAIKELLRKNNL